MQKFVLLVYNEPALLDALPAGKADSMMRDCLAHADELALEGRLLGFQQLEGPETARSVRIRNGRVSTFDGPFSETKEVLGGFNIIEAENMDEAVKIAEQFPWSETGSVEVRPIREIASVRRAVGAS